MGSVIGALARFRIATAVMMLSHVSEWHQELFLLLAGVRKFPVTSCEAPKDFLAARDVDRLIRRVDGANLFLTSLALLLTACLLVC